MPRLWILIDYTRFSHSVFNQFPCIYYTVSQLMSFDPDDLTAGNLLKLHRRQLEDRIGRPGGGPDRGILQQVLVQVGFDGLGVADRWNTSDGESGRLPDEGCVGAPDGFAGILTDPLLVDAIGTAGQDQDRFPAHLPPEYERLNDLTQAASDPVGGLLGGARALWELDDRARAAKRVQVILDFLRGRIEGGVRVHGFFARTISTGNPQIAVDFASTRINPACSIAWRG